MIARLRNFPLLAPLAMAETYRALLHALAGVVLASVAFAVLLGGWIVTVVFAITPLVFPLLFALRWAVGLLAAGQAYVMNELFGTRLTTPLQTTRGASFWSRSLNTLRDAAFWKQQAHLLLTWPLALIPLTIVWWAGELITLPIWYRWVDSADVFGFLEIDSFAGTLPAVAVGLVVLVVAVHVLRLYAAVSRRLASRLLSGEPGPQRTPAQVSARRLRGLTITVLISTSIVAVLGVIWWLTTPNGYFWPIWPLLSLALFCGIPGWLILVLERPEIARFTLGSQALAMQIGASVILFGFLVGVWAISTNGYFWPVWAGLGLAFLAALHAAILYGRREHRIRELEETRAGVVDVQEAELRRIERDLHDGAQARLVALGMSLGMAEEKLRTDPEGAQALLAEARSGAREALEDLRDLARGIHPPILTDRGLEAAVAALAARSPVPVALTVGVPTRLPAAVETAAYFVAAEALANAIKHAEATRVAIRIWRSNGTLVVEIEDDGRGGADASGNGLTGLRQRVGALDGSLGIVSPTGGPTTVRAELPCE
jgi:signal transduction histidine kinase